MLLTWIEAIGDGGEKVLFLSLALLALAFPMVAFALAAAGCKLALALALCFRFTQELVEILLQNFHHGEYSLRGLVVGHLLQDCLQAEYCALFVRVLQPAKLVQTCMV